MGDRKCKMGYEKQNMGGRRWKMGDWRLEIGDQRLEIGDLRLEIENGKKFENRRQKMRDEKEMGNKIVDICSSLNLKCLAIRGQRQEFHGIQGNVNEKLLPCCPPLLINGVLKLS